MKMNELIEKLHAHRSALLPENDADFELLNAINGEVNVVVKHSADKITFAKEDLLRYHDLGFKYKLIEGFNMAISYLESLAQAEENISEE